MKRLLQNLVFPRVLQQAETGLPKAGGAGGSALSSKRFPLPFLLVLFTLAFSGNTFAQLNTYYEAANTPPGTQCTNWNLFRAGLVPGSYSRVVIRGTFLPAGIECDDAIVANAFAAAIKNNTTYLAPYPVQGHIWHICDRYTGEIFIDPATASGGPYTACSGSNCPPNYNGHLGLIIRPCFGSVGYSGVNTPTCGGPAQEIWVEFFGSDGPDNAAVKELVAPVNFCTGTYDVKVRIQNKGNNLIDSVRVNWTLNGGNTNTIYTSSPLDTLRGAGNNTLDVTLTNMNFPDGVAQNFKVWTSHPNGKIDTVNKDDTLYFSLKPALSGTFTIGGANPDYATFSAAANDLNNSGICGPVTFIVRPGTYTERFTLNSISGASATNTIRFLGSGKGSTIITYAGTSTTDMATVLLNGTDHVHFRDMSVMATSTSFGTGFLLTNKADSNSFRNIEIRAGLGSNAGNTAGVALSGSTTSNTTAGNAGNYNTFDSLSVEGAYHGLVAYGVSSTGEHSYGNKVLNSSFLSQYYYGIYMNYQNDVVVHNNTVNGMRNTTAYGIYLNYSSDYRVTDNYSTSPYMALYLNYCDRYLMSGNKNSVTANNMLLGGTYYTMYSNNSYDVKFYHNTVVNDGRYANNAYFNANTNLDVRNNIFVNKNAGATSNAVYIAGGTQTAFDYNVYRTNGGTFIYHDVQIANLAAWKTAKPALNANSYVHDPLLRSATDLHLTPQSPITKGIFVGVSTDIDGDERCVLQPTIGADERIYQGGINPVAGFAIQDTMFENSPVRFINTSTALFNEPLGYNWYINGSAVSDLEDILHTFATAGTYTVSLKARTCTGADSTGITVQVVAPSSTPVSDFSASLVVLNASPVADSLVLTDLSSHGPTAWTWDINPPLGVVISDPNAANPVVLFSEPGYYDVCLTTENAVGVGTTNCKPAYVYVNDEQWMGNNFTSTFPGGRISDDGWIDKYYPNTRSSFLIDPDSCAAELFLKFTSFKLNDFGDSLRVFDGQDHNGVLLGSFTAGNPLPGGSAGLVAYSGAMYLEWVTDGAGEDAGFEAFWSITHDNNGAAPVAGFTYPNTIFTNQVIDLVSTSAKAGYSWDITPTGYAGNSSTLSYSWNTAGVYDVKLKVSNCAGTDSSTQQITVTDPTSAPVIGFYADQVRVPMHTTVNFFDTSGQGPTAWTWSASPSTVVFNTPATGQNASIYFYIPGTYQITLKASNSVGEDSLVKTAYVEVTGYCTPAVATLSSDIGISRVQLGSTDNRSSIGQQPYTQYTSLAPERLYQSLKYGITLERSTGLGSMSRKVWIDYNGNGDFSDAGELVLFESPSTTLSYTDSFTVPVSNFSGYTMMRVGTAYGNNSNLPCVINTMGEFEDYPVFIERSTAAPVITLLGSDPIDHAVGTAYTDAGATAVDHFNRDLTGSLVGVSTVNENLLGTYTYYYTVTDATGNKDSVARTVEVTDKVAPVLSYIGSDTITVEVFGPINDPGISGNDNYYSTVEISADSSQVNTSKVGVYTITYTGSDSSSNSAQLVRWVKVVDTGLPVLTLNGSDTLLMDVFTSFTDPGVKATDNYCITQNWQMTTTLDTAVLGSYVVSYSITDCEGNTSMTIQRVVKVVDRTAPVIVLTGAENVSILRWEDYADAGYTVNDNYDVVADLTIDTLGSFVNSGIENAYYIQYRATDKSGNSSLTNKRIIDVRGISSVGKEVAAGIRLFPNPASSSVTLDFENALSGSVSITVMDITGRQVLTTTTASQSTVLSVETLAAGMYQVNILQEGKLTTVKLNVVR